MPTLGFSECGDSSLSPVGTLEAKPMEMSQEILVPVRREAFKPRQLSNVDFIAL